MHYSLGKQQQHQVTNPIEIVFVVIETDQLHLVFFTQ